MSKKQFGTQSLAQHQSKNASTQSFIEMISNGGPIAFSEAFFGSLARGPGIALMSQIIGPQPQAVAGSKGSGWCLPSDVCWFINPINCSYKYNKP